MSLVTVCWVRDAGAEVTIAGRSPDKFLQAQQELGPVHTVVMDMTDEDAVEKVSDGFSHVDHGRISAGTIVSGAIVKNAVATLRCIVDARLWGLTSMVRRAAPQMAQGSITFTSGSLSSRPRPGSVMLTAMLSAVEALALELAPVRVNAVISGLIDTLRLHIADGPERDTITKNRAAMLPGRRVGTAEEVAQVIVLLMTNAYVTGEVDGGGRYV
jgi:NAD(P)-dependent dehydrogenase (short-subunit alcohol dehydrogenase family)